MTWNISLKSEVLGAFIFGLMGPEGRDLQMPITYFKYEVQGLSRTFQGSLWQFSRIIARLI